MTEDESTPQPPETSPPDDPPPGTSRRRRHKWRRRILAVAIGTILPCILVELAVRMAWGSIVTPFEKSLLEAESSSLGLALRKECLASPALWMRERGNRPGTLYLPDPKRGMRLKPNTTYVKTLDHVPPNGLSFTITTDRHGLRGANRPPPPEGALRVLAVGDSMTFGEGVEDTETWPVRLEELLAESLAPRPVRVYNAGVVSFGQQEERDVIYDLVPRLQIDLVILQFTIANDVVDNMRWLDGPGPLREDPTACQTLEHHILLINPLARWSRAYRLAMWRWGRHAIKYRYMVEGPNLDRSARLIAELRALTSERAGREIPFGVLIAPSIVQVEGYLAELVLDTVRINDGIRDRLEERGIPVLDPLEGLQRRSDEGQELFIPVDRHWNAAGHQAVAEEALPFVQRLLGGGDG